MPAVRRSTRKTVVSQVTPVPIPAKKKGRKYVDCAFTIFCSLLTSFPRPKAQKKSPSVVVEDEVDDGQGTAGQVDAVEAPAPAPVEYVRRTP